MAKDPAFLFYTGDFSTGTQFFTDEQVGKYVRLLMAQHQLGHLYEKDMMKICKTYDEDVFSKFKQDDDGRYYNERLEKEVIKRQNYSKSRAENRQKSKEKSETYDFHMENKNENNIIKGVEIFKENGIVKLSDGTFQPLGKSQKVRALHDDIQPNEILKGKII